MFNVTLQNYAAQYVLIFSTQSLVIDILNNKMNISTKYR